MGGFPNTTAVAEGIRWHRVWGLVLATVSEIKGGSERPLKYLTDSELTKLRIGALRLLTMANQEREQRVAIGQLRGDDPEPMPPMSNG